MSQRPKLLVILPLFNDWESADSLVRDLVTELRSRFDLHVCIIDDGSTETPPAGCLNNVGCDVTTVCLGTNLGHQRAVCVGLSVASRDTNSNFVVVMDADGEDSAQSVSSLLLPVVNGEVEVAVGQRVSRSEGRAFKFLYSIYSLMFRIMTGYSQDFGNFSALSRPAVLRIALSADAWNHYPAALMKSKLTLRRVPISRERRYSGESKMDVSSLVTHGLAGLSVFADRVFSRLLFLTAVASGLLISVVSVGVVLRIIIQVPIPGWLALVTAAAFVALFQVLSTLGVVTFLNLSMRSTFTPPPRDFAESYVIDTSHRGIVRRD